MNNVPRANRLAGLPVAVSLDVPAQPATTQDRSQWSVAPFDDLTVPAPEPFDVAPIEEADLPAADTHLPVSLVASVDFEDHGATLVMPPPKPAGNSSSDGITGVFRKTGSSIATVGVKTGSTIVGAFRAVGGAFRKIL